MKKIAYILFVLLVAASCSKKAEVVRSVEDLIPNVGGLVCLEGEVVHVCPCGGQKLKLKLADGTMLKVIPGSKLGTFSKLNLNKKKVKICGELSEVRLSKEYLDSMYSSQTLACHIDYTPCTDTAWVNYQWREGNAEKILATVSINQQKQMEQTGKNYISIFTIEAASIDEVK